ncbi:hypothetical protein M5K25_017550 [Dendrobium thyrsiflorum]|uniref:Protein kinase domain-containing protein n=1 Tax=Dendrobium thyrsiflorum TaxID=117978 RepID=A0ABD0UUX0_DENTH
MAAELLLAISLSLLFLPFSSSSFSSIFLSCGTSSYVNVANDNPPRTFTPDGNFLISSSKSKTESFSSSSVTPLYSTARLFTSLSSYSFDVDVNAFYILRLHFFPFNFTSKAQFDVSALNRYLLLSSFSPSTPSKPDVKEFFLWVEKSPLVLTFSPSPNNLAFINALELIASPPNLINGSKPTYITASGNSQEENFSPQAMETVYRVNVGGQLITPANDTLWRTWVTDENQFLVNRNLSVEKNTTGQIEYPTEKGLTDVIAPEMVYSTAREMNFDPVSGMANSAFNLTWSFNVPPGFQYFVRMHFCDFWITTHPSFYFEVYLGDFMAHKDLNPGNMTSWRTMIPFYFDFVVDAPGSGPLNVSVGPAANSVPPDAFLNGLEIIKLSNSHLSLAGEFGLDDSGTGSHGGNDLLSILLPSILGGVVLLIFLLFVLQLCLRRRRSKPKNLVEEQKDTTNASWLRYNAGAGAANLVFSTSTTDRTPKSSASPRLNLGLQISYSEVIIATNNFDEKLVIGSGGFGKVYKGVLGDGTKVAVKRGVPGSRQGYPEFQTEIVVLSRIRHRYLVSLIGYCEEHSEMILVYEYMEKGTLKSYLYGSNLPCLSWKQRLEICICAAKGLHYLHTGYSQSIIHRDVKSNNILLGENFEAKVSDFGLSRLGPSCGETHVSTDLKGTFGYFDPEYVKIMKLTEKSDVYSFGVVLFEVLCARPAIVDHVNLAEFALHWIKKGQLEKIVDQRLAGKINENSLRKFTETAAKCSADYGTDRPSIGDVLWNLEYALQLQVSGLLREPFEDSGIVDESEIVLATSVGRIPSATNEGDEEAEAAWTSDSGMTTSLVFSQLVKGEGSAEKSLRDIFLKGEVYYIGKSLHLISWGNTCKPVSKGGLGIASLQALKFAINCDIISRFYNLPSLLSTWLRARYFSPWRPCSNTDSALWKNICSTAFIAKHNFNFNIYADSPASIVWDHWCSGTQLTTMLRDVFLHFNNYLRDTISNWISNSKWNAPLCLGDTLVTFLSSVPISTLQKPHITWKDQPHSKFKDFYNGFFDREMDVEWYQYLWHKKKCLRCSVFTWLAFNGGLKTVDALARRSIAVADPVCPLCRSDQETLNHIFFDCNYSFSVITRFLPSFHSFYLRPSLFQAFQHVGSLQEAKVVKRGLLLILNAIIYHLWRERNNRRFNSSSLCVVSIAKFSLCFPDLFTALVLWSLASSLVLGAMMLDCIISPDDGSLQLGYSLTAVLATGEFCGFVDVILF